MKHYLSKKAAVSVAFLSAFLAILFFGAARQRYSLGQQYLILSVDGKTVGATAEDFSVSEEFLSAKKAALRERAGEYLLWNPMVETSTGKGAFTYLLTADELRERLKEAVSESRDEHSEPLGYTVNVGEYFATFPSVAEAELFLTEAKKDYDPDGRFETVCGVNPDHETTTVGVVLGLSDTEKTGGETGALSDGGLSETLSTENQTADETDTTSATSDFDPMETASGGRAGFVPAFLNPLTRPEAAAYVDAGLTTALLSALSDAIEHPDANRYQTGLVDVDFAVPVYLYSDYVSNRSFADLSVAVAEVTKEEETNKLYTVKAGDTLSQIAEQYGLSLDYLRKLNEFSEDHESIYIDEELVVAVPEPELKIRTVEGILYEEDFTANPIIIPNNDWYTTKQETLEEGTVGHREVNAFITYENGVESDRTPVHTTVLVESTPEVIEKGTIVPPTYIKPISGGRFSSGFGRRWGRMHKGVDWATPTGTIVFASSDGVVEYAGWGNGYGNTILLGHPDGRKTRVAHLSKILVSAGQSVRQGQTIGLSGSTGRSTGPHVHFEIYINGTQVNPLDYIN